MQRHPERPATIAVISFAAGTGVSLFDDDLPDASTLLPVACITVVAFTALRRLSRTYEERVRDLAKTMTGDQEARRRALDQRERRIQEREAQARRSQEIASLRVRSVAARLDQVTGDLFLQQRRNEELQNDYTDLAKDHNELVREMLTAQCATQPPQPRAAAVGYGPEGAEEHGPRRQRHRGPIPFLTIVETRDRQEMI